MNAGLRKVLSRMGISTLASYRNGQLFEVVGLGRQLCEEFFESAEHFAEATSLEEVIHDYLHNHALAFTQEKAALKDAGFYRYRKEGEVHATSPELMRQLHGYIKNGNREDHRQLEDLGVNRAPAAVRDLLEIDFK